MKTNYLGKQLKQFAFGTLVVLTTITSLSSIAGDRVGNGGDAVVCPDRVYMLDEMEFEQLGLTYTSNPNLSSREQVYMILDNVKSSFPKMMKVLREYADELLSDIESFKKKLPVDESRNYALESTLFTKDNLRDIQDSEHDSLPPTCKLKQVAKHGIATTTFEKKYKIDYKILKLMSNRSVASLVVHEVVYRYLSEKYYHKNSVHARSFGNAISSQEILELSSNELINFLSETRIDSIDVDGIRILTHTTYSKNSYTAKFSNRYLPIIGQLKGRVSLDEDCYSYGEPYISSFSNGDGTYSYSSSSSTRLECNNEVERVRYVRLNKNLPLSLKSIILKSGDRICGKSDKSCTKPLEVHFMNLISGDWYDRLLTSEFKMINGEVFIDKDEINQLFNSQDGAIVFMNNFQSTNKRCVLVKEAVNRRKIKLRLLSDGQKVFEKVIKKSRYKKEVSLMYKKVVDGKCTESI